MAGKEIGVVLVHGAWADGSSWSKVIALLAARGVRSIAAQLSMRTLDDDVASVDRAIDRAGGPVVLVGHATTEEQAILAAVQRPASVGAIGVMVGPTLWTNVPAWYVLAQKDRMVTPDNQRFMAERMQASIRPIESDHAPLVTAPDPVVSTILEAVQASSH